MPRTLRWGCSVQPWLLLGLITATRQFFPILLCDSILISILIINKPHFPQLLLLSSLSSTQAERVKGQQPPILCFSFEIFHTQTGGIISHFSKQNETKQTTQNQTYLVGELSKQIRGKEKDHFHPIPVRLTGEPPSTPLPWAHGVFDQLSTG